MQEDAARRAEEMAKELRALAGAVMRLLAASEEPHEACQLLGANAEVMLQWADTDTATAIVGQLMLPPPGERWEVQVQGSKRSQPNLAQAIVLTAPFLFVASVCLGFRVQCAHPDQRCMA